MAWKSAGLIRYIYIYHGLISQLLVGSSRDIRYSKNCSWCFKYMCEERSIVCPQTAVFAWNRRRQIKAIKNRCFVFRIKYIPVPGTFYCICLAWYETRRCDCQRSIIPIKHSDKWLVFYDNLIYLDILTLSLFWKMRGWNIVGKFPWGFGC